MLWGDQWVCGLCGMHNYELRTKCRGCKKEKEDCILYEESAEEMIAKLPGPSGNKEKNI